MKQLIVVVVSMLVVAEAFAGTAVIRPPVQVSEPGIFGLMAITVAGLLLVKKLKK